MIRGMNKSGLSSPGGAAVLLVDVKARQKREATDLRWARRAAAVRPNIILFVAVLIYVQTCMINSLELKDAPGSVWLLPRSAGD